MKKLKLFALAAMALIGFSGIAIAADATMLMQDDFVGISFWVISMGMLAATAFFFMEAGNVASGWRTSVIVAGLVTGIAFIHYMYMREVWVATGDSPTVYRYIDWLITVPLQMIEFYLIFSAVQPNIGLACPGVCSSASLSRWPSATAARSQVPWLPAARKWARM